MLRRRITDNLNRDSLSFRTTEVRDIFRRSRESVLLSALTGIATGVLVFGFEWLVEEAYHFAFHEAGWLGAFLPVVGLVLTAVILHTAGRGATASTSDEYLRAFHDNEYSLRPRLVIARLAAAVATLGTGGSLGLEGPSLYAGAGLGAAIHRRLPRQIRSADHRVFLVAGAAAGVAAIFKAPATGAIFALEVPYRGDMARRMLLPALVAAASGYLTFVTLTGSTLPLLSTGAFEGTNFQLIDLAGALLIGVASAIGARSFAKLMRFAKKQTYKPLPARLLVSSLILVGLYYASDAIAGEPLSLGAGYETFREWLYVEPRGLALWAIAAMFAIRCLASAATTAGGGVGGLFVPLVVGGGLTGRFIAEVVHPARFMLYTLLGVAAFLGAGYRVPLAAVMFVAETTGQPDFVVPALFAAVAAELVMGDQSITAFQRLAGADSNV